jgi:hypothetical protein
MTTLNAKAGNAYDAMIAHYESEHPGEVWHGFDNDRGAFEAGWEDGYHKAVSDFRYLGIKVLKAYERGALTAERKHAYETAINVLRELS